MSKQVISFELKVGFLCFQFKLLKNNWVLFFFTWLKYLYIEENWSVLSNLTLKLQNLSEKDQFWKTKGHNSATYPEES